MRPDPTFFDTPVSDQVCEEFFLPETELTTFQRWGVLAGVLAATFVGIHYSSVNSVKINRLVEEGEVRNMEFKSLSLPKPRLTNSCFNFSATLPLAEPIPVTWQSLPAELPKLSFAMPQEDYHTVLDKRHSVGQVDDLLAELKKQENFPECDIEAVSQKLIQQHPDRDFDPLKRWIKQATTEEGGTNLAIAARFSDVGDHDAAFAFYERAMAETQSPETHFQVGAAQLFGLGTPTNFSLAQMNLFTAQRENHPSAAYLLGMIYLSGVCGSVNETHAYRFFQIAIEKGNRLACGEAGRMRETGLGVSRDLSRAQTLYREGAESGDVYCIKQLMRLESEGQLNESLVTPSEVVDYQNRRPNIPNKELSTAARQLLPGGFLQ